MSKAMVRAECARLTEAYLLKGGVITVIGADWRSRPRQRVTRQQHRVLPLWMRLAIYDRARARGLFA